MRALVTGGAGLIGSHLADLLDKNGIKVRILDNLESETHHKKPVWLKDKYQFIKGDVKDKKTVEHALEDVDYIFHQAAYGGFTPEISKYVLSNSLGTANILEVIQQKKLKIKKLVVASSQAIYGEGKYRCTKDGIIEPEFRALEQLLKRQWEVKCPKCKRDLLPVATDENKTIDPATVYAITKYSQERLVIKIGKSLGVPTVALRYAVTFGPRQSLFNPYTGVVSIFSTRIINNLPPVIYEDGNQVRDFIFVEDVAAANFLVSQKDEANYQVYNVCNSKPITVINLVKILNESYSTNVNPVIEGEFRLGEVRHLFLDNTRLKTLGWEPKTSLSEGVAKYVEWIKTQGSIKEYFTNARNQMLKKGVVIKT